LISRKKNFTLKVRAQHLGNGGKRMQIQGQPELYSKTFSQKHQKKKKS
jgi:hypothetical protein